MALKDLVLGSDLRAQYWNRRQFSKNGETSDVHYALEKKKPRHVRKQRPVNISDGNTVTGTSTGYFEEVLTSAIGNTVWASQRMQRWERQLCTSREDCLAQAAFVGSQMISRDAWVPFVRRESPTTQPRGKFLNVSFREQVPGYRTIGQHRHCGGTRCW